MCLVVCSLTATERLLACIERNGVRSRLNFFSERNKAADCRTVVHQNQLVQLRIYQINIHMAPEQCIFCNLAKSPPNKRCIGCRGLLTTASADEVMNRNELLNGIRFSKKWTVVLTRT